MNTHIRDNLNVLAQPPMAKMTKAANQSIPNGGVPTGVLLDTVVIDTELAVTGFNMADTTNNRINVFTAGKFLVMAQASWAADTTGYRALQISHSAGGVIAENRVAPNIAANQRSHSVWTIYTAALTTFFNFNVFHTATGGAINLNAQASYSPAFVVVRIGS